MSHIYGHFCLPWEQIHFFFLSLSSSCLQGARLAGRDSRRSNRADTGKLCGVFIVQGWKKDPNWMPVDQTRVERTRSDCTKLYQNVYWTRPLIRPMLCWVDWDLKLDQAEPYQMVMIQEQCRADWRENHKLHWKYWNWRKKKGWVPLWFWLLRDECRWLRQSWENVTVMNLRVWGEKSVSGGNHLSKWFEISELWGLGFFTPWTALPLIKHLFSSARKFDLLVHTVFEWLLIS